MKRKSSTKTCVRAALARAAFGKLRAARRKQKQKFTGAAEHDRQTRRLELALERGPLGDDDRAKVEGFPGPKTIEPRADGGPARARRS